MDNLFHTQAKVVECGILIIHIHSGYRLPERVRPEHKHASEIEIIAEGTFLTIDQRMPAPQLLAFPIRNDLVMVCIQHVCTRILSDSQNTFAGKHSHLQRMVLRIYQEIIFGNRLGNLTQDLGPMERSGGKELNF